jgi:hypothetical protein
MKTMILAIFITLAAPVVILSQDLLIKKNGERFNCKILNEDSTHVYFKVNQFGQDVETYIDKNDLLSVRYDSVYRNCIIPNDIVTLGVGMGLDYGGFGFGLLVYPQRNFGLFAGGGYAIAGMGYNAGIKLRFITKESTSKAVGYVTGMYGYNAAVSVMNATEYNKLFYGATIGAGVDIRSKNKKGGYWSLAILVPFRSSEIETYLNELETNYNVERKSDFLPVAISIGYRIVVY